jgi:hypothetical protein
MDMIDSVLPWLFAALVPTAGEDIAFAACGNDRDDALTTFSDRVGRCPLLNCVCDGVRTTEEMFVDTDPFLLGTAIDCA